MTRRRPRLPAKVYWVDFSVDLAPEARGFSGDTYQRAAPAIRGDASHNGPLKILAVEIRELRGLVVHQASIGRNHMMIDGERVVFSKVLTFLYVEWSVVRRGELVRFEISNPSRERLVNTIRLYGNPSK